MSPLEELVARLAHARKSGHGWIARCPAHSDAKASLSVTAAPDGTVLVKCFAGCTVEEVCDAVGIEVRQLFPAIRPRSASAEPAGGFADADTRTFRSVEEAIRSFHRSLGKPSARWTYHDARGCEAGMVVRWDTPQGKEIRPFRVVGLDGEWAVGAMRSPRPLYRREQLDGADRVVVVEGEKCADAAVGLGFTATTCAGGALAAQHADWKPLADKEVLILPDNDPPGRKFAETVKAILKPLRCRVVVVDLPGLPPKGDIVDWIASHPTGDGLREEIESLASASATDPSPVADADIAHEPFPVEVLPEPVRTFVRASAIAVGCDASYVALPVLAAAAAAIGTTRRLQLKRGWTVPSILWCAVVGDSGTAKTPAFRLALDPVRRRQSEALDTHQRELMRHEQAMATHDKDMAAWQKKGAGDPPMRPMEPTAERFIVADTTVEALAPILRDNPRGILLARDELAGWIGSFDRYSGKGADAANWLSMFNGESLVVDRKTGTPRTIQVKEAAVCVVGGIQPAILRKSLTADLRANGMAARLLLACPPRKPKAWTEDDIDPKHEIALRNVFENLYALSRDSDGDGGSFPVIYHLTAEAKSEWITFYAEHQKEQATLGGDLSAAWSKLEEYPARLALVLHCLLAGRAGNGPGTEVGVETMRAGIVLATWFKREAARVYAMLGTMPGETDRLREWIAERGGSATVRDVVTGCRWMRPAARAEEVMAEIVAKGAGEWVAVPPPPHGGKAMERLSVSASATDTATVADADTPGRLFPERRGLPD